MLMMYLYAGEVKNGKVFSAMQEDKGVIRKYITGLKSG